MTVLEPEIVTDSSSQMRLASARFWLLALGVVLISTLIQVPGARYEKVIDDFMLIDDQTLRGCGDDTLRGCFTGGVFKMYYRPLLSASFMWGFKMHGLPPFWYRVENLAMHAVLTALVFWFFRLLFRSDKAALAAGTLFAVHPLHVPVTTFIGGRTDVLSLMFLVPCAIATIKMGKSRTLAFCGLWLIVGMVCFFLALASKEQSFLVVFLLPLLFRIGRGRAEVPPAPKDTALLLWLYLLPLALFGALATKYTPRNTYDGADWSLALRIETVGRTLWYYVKAFVFPTVNTLHQSTAGAWDIPQYGIMALGFGAAALWLCCLVRVRHGREILFLMLWMTLTVLPCTNVIPIPSQAVAPYRAFIPMLGVCGLFGLGFATLWQRYKTQMAGVYAFALLASGYLYVSLCDVPAWRNELTVMYAEIQADPNFLPAWSGAAGLLQGQGDYAAAERHYAVAMKMIFPDTDDPNRQIAQLDTLALRRRVRSASSLRYKGKDVVNRMVRGRGGNMQMTGRIEEAIAYYRVALAANPTDGELRDYLAMCYELMHESAMQEKILQEGARLTPNAARYDKLGRFYFRTGRWLNARDALAMALGYGRDGSIMDAELREVRLMYDQTVKITNPR